MTRYLIAFLILFTVLMCLVKMSEGKAIDLSLTPYVGWNQGEWGSGRMPSPTGTMHDSSLTRGISGQIIYNPWRFKPTLDVDLKFDRYDFDTPQVWEQNARPITLSVRAGLTYEVSHMTFFGVVGISYTNNRPTLIERIPYSYHGRNIEVRDKTLSGKLGGSYLWKVGPFRMGPQLSVELFLDSLGFERCRNVKTERIVPRLGWDFRW